MSVAEMLAHARAEKSGGSAAVETSVKTAADEPQPSAPAAEPTADGEVTSKKDEITDLAGILAYCRQVDAG